MLYFFDTLPVHPPPQPLETFTSFVPRVAVANGIPTVERMSSLCFPSRTVRLRNFADYPLLSFEELPRLIVSSIDTLRATTFFYLVETFGRSTHPQHASRFLAGTLAETLRYCPICIRERPWYIMPWRFTMLSGCISHHCWLRDCCPACGLPIPLLSSSFRVGECPSCGVALTIGDVEELPLGDHATAQQRYRDLEFLLQPCTENHLPNSGRGRLIGNQFALLRGEQGLSVNTVTKHLAITSDALRGLEWGASEKGSTRFAIYIAYAELLNVPLRTIVHNAFTQQDSEIKIVRDALGRRRTVYFNGSSTPSIKPDNPIKRWTDEVLVEAIEQITSDLISQGRTETGTTILGLLGLRRQLLKSYPKARSLYKDLVSKLQQQKRSTYFERVKSAICQLQMSDIPLSGQLIELTSGVSYSTIHRWPELRELVGTALSRPIIPEPKHAPNKSIKHTVDAPSSSKLEAELLTQVEEAIKYLRTQQQDVTQVAICRLLKKSRSGLMKHASVRARLQQVAEEVRNPERTRLQRAERETKLEGQVTECIARLSKEGIIPSQNAIAAEVGMSASALRKYSSVRRLLDTLIQLRRQKRDALEN